MSKKADISGKIIMLLIIVCTGIILRDTFIGRTILAVILISVLSMIVFGRLFCNRWSQNRTVRVRKKGKQGYRSHGNKLFTSYTAPEGKPSILDPAVPVWDVIRPMKTACVAQIPDSLVPDNMITAKRVLMELSCLKCGGTGLKHENGSYSCVYCGSIYKLRDFAVEEV